MTSVLLLHSPDPAGMPDLAADVAAAGYTLAGQGDCANLVRDALRTQPDVVLCWQPRPDEAFLAAIATLQAQQSLPLLVFTRDAAAEPMRRALEAGAHGWVVQGYARERLRPLVQLAQAREARERQQRAEIADLRQRLQERKLVDQAKGILMRARRLGEQEAFALLRSASMQGNQRVGQVSRQVIEAARVAQAINLAGQQRMLSQRLVKLQALACTRTEAPAAQALVRETVARIEQNLGILDKELSPATFGDLLAATRDCWDLLRARVEAPADAGQLPELDREAEQLLQQSDALVLALESSGVAPTARVVNLAGRQRMLSQRMAKLALLAALPGASAGLAAAMDATAREFEEGLQALAATPLSSPEIRELLARGQAAWEALRAAEDQAGTSAGRARLAAASEDLLEAFDRLTEALQHSIQVLMG